MGVTINFLEESQTLVSDEKQILNPFKEKLLEAAKMRSISFKGRRLLRDTTRSVSFNGRDLEENVHGSSSFNGREKERRLLLPISCKVSHTETTSLKSIRFKGMDSRNSSRGSSFRARNSEMALTKLNSSMKKNFDSSSLRSSSFKEGEAAVKIQKVYKSYRTRRNLADCAVVAEELWWQAIDLMLLKQNTISFFDIEKPEKTISRWSRSRIKAAKVEKGLSKDDKARKLAFQHWLEAIDPRHRYGQNLHCYYDTWFESDTVQPFFYWLDVGDGRDLNLDCCSRAKLQQQCIKYLGKVTTTECAVVAEELWWQAIDSVVLKQNTVLFYDIEKPETAVSRWSRARIKAAKVGNGLSKDDKARKLAFKHWLEAIDPRHRYGPNLHLYYSTWFETVTVQPFFYWLDVGDGRDLNLDGCPRAKLQQQCIKYLGLKEREQYEVIVVDGKLLYMYSGHLVDTSKGSKGTKWIFVLSTLKKLYVGQKEKGAFQHSSFLAGGATTAAGRLVVDEGVIKSISPYSGHYRPTEENFNAFIRFLEENNIDLTNVQKIPAAEDELAVHLGKNLTIESEPNSEAERDEPQLVEELGRLDSQKEFTETNTMLEETEANTAFWPSARNETREHCSRLTPPQSVDSIEEGAIANNFDKSMRLKEELAVVERESNTELEDETAGCQYQEQVRYKRSMSDKNLEDTRTKVPHKALLQRLQSKKSLQSYQLGKEPSFKWSTGAGPRLVCIADYPSELRVKALEKVNL